MKIIKICIFSFLSMCFFLYSCGTKEQSISVDLNNDSANHLKDTSSVEEQKEEARKAMVSLMKSYEAAVNEFDIDKVISHYRESPEFKVISDGQVLDYDKWIEQVLETPQLFSKIEVEWDTIYVSVLSPDVVTAMVPFHETLIDKEGNRIPIIGEVTWTAVKKGGEWKFAYGHGSHQPDDGKNTSH